MSYGTHLLTEITKVLINVLAQVFHIVLYLSHLLEFFLYILLGQNDAPY